MDKVRVRFAPSPTGFLHIGGVRTALYNYLYARKHGGKFIVRIEDTDRKRFVEEAEGYINESLKWLGIEEDEGVEWGGDYGPYRQSERSEIYGEYAEYLLENDYAYYAFDTEKELEKMRETKKAQGVYSPKYDQSVRAEMENSLTLSYDEVQRRLKNDEPYVIRMKVPENETITFQDEIRGEVSFETHELDDKVIVKRDGLPTYHFANVIDDHLMEITDVIRGEEWLSSTAHHVLLYRFFDWENSMPRFAHLPLILKPSGKGKLSKRDGAKLGIPVFPLGFKDSKTGDMVKGFREYGFNADAVVNFLALLGWSPGTEQELFSKEELVENFSLDNISKGGARFDYDKALWFNQQYIIKEDPTELSNKIFELFKNSETEVPDPLYDSEWREQYVKLMQQRVTLYPEFLNQASYIFEPIEDWDEKQIKKRWKDNSAEILSSVKEVLVNTNNWNSEILAQEIKTFIKGNNLSFGAVLPLLRLATAGTMQGPDLYPMMELMGKENTVNRIDQAIEKFPEISHK